MAPKTPHRPGANSTFRDAWIRTFGFSLEAPKASAKLKITVAILALLGTGVAAAAWQVNDAKTQEEIREVQKRLGEEGKGTVTGRINDLNEKLEVGEPDRTMPEMIVEPIGQEGLNTTQPSSTLVAIDKLCTAGANTTLGQQQQSLCQDLANTELAQYRFSLRMFERASKNYEHLDEIEQHRLSLDKNDYGKIQQNTNELLALTAHMDNDRDRYQTYMAAYSARIAHIRNAQTSLTRNALKGSGSLSFSSL